jgi:uncharacterized protein YjbJ (UPF0337 family)
MNKDLLESQWTQIRDILHEKFSNLTDEDIKQINGRYDQLVAKLQQKYGYSREEAEERVRSWNFDRFATTAKPINVRDDRVYREEKVRKENDSMSFFKWLLAIAIPLLLLGAYFSATRTPELQPTPPAAQEQMATETPADLSLSNGIRDALMSQPNRALEMQNVLITTHNGVVTVSGTVPTSAARDSIINTSQNFSGVRQVIDHLQIR